MFATIWAFMMALVLVAGSTQIAEPWLSWTQLLMGIWLAIAGAITGWQWANRK